MALAAHARKTLQYIYEENHSFYLAGVYAGRRQLSFAGGAFFTGRFERPVTQAALAAQTPLFSLHFNDTSRQDAFNTALGLAALVPPPGQKSFAQIRKAEYPGVRDVHVIVAVRADVARQLQANGIPVSSLRNADAYTTSFVGKDGKRVIHIF